MKRVVIKYKKLVTLILFIFIAAIASFMLEFKPNRWAAYFKNKLNDPPREFVIKGLELISDPNNVQKAKALDLGAGVGHESLLLLKKGFFVVAVDSQKEAFEILLRRKEFQPFQNKLITFVKKFEDLFEDLQFTQEAPFNLIVASFSLSFCSPNFFQKFWTQIKSAMSTDAYFIGNFFDPGFTTFSELDRKNMTFFTKDEVLTLFDSFEILHFEEVKEPALEKGKFNHYYNVVAKKH